MTRDIPPNDYERSLHSAAYHLTMAVRLIESEDLSSDTFEGYRGRQAVAGAVSCASRILIEIWPQVYPDASGFKHALREAHLFRSAASLGVLSEASISEVAPHVRTLLGGLTATLEGLGRG